MNTNTQKQSALGFSLVESLVVIAISTFVMLAITEAIIFFYRTNDYAIEQSAAIRSAKIGVDSLVQDIREAAFADTGAYPVESMGTSSLTVYADVNRDDDVERVRYYLDETDFQRVVTAPTGTPTTYSGEQTEETISRSIRNEPQGEAIFSYYDASGGEITNLANRQDLAFVVIELIVNIDPNRQPDNTTIRSSATLRNVNKPS